MGIFDDEDRQIGELDKNLRKTVRDFIKANYKGVIKVSKTVNADGKYEASSIYGVVVTNKKLESLTNGLFVWSEVKGNFDCSECRQLTSLYGAPKYVGKDFLCSYCHTLRSMEGAPREVAGNFFCRFCKGLISLSGAPEITGGDFDCSFCENIESFDWVPTIIGNLFSCANCLKLRSLGDLPQRVPIFEYYIRRFDHYYLENDEASRKYINVTIHNNPK